MQKTGYAYKGVLTPVKDEREIGWAGYPGLGSVTANVPLTGRTWIGSWFFGLLGTDITDENVKRRENEGVYNE